MRYSIGFLSRLSVIVIGFLISYQAFAQKAATSNLSCDHIWDIERSFLAYHVLHDQPSKEIEDRTIDQFIEKLDGSKIYLLNKDVSLLKRKLKGIVKATANKQCTPIVEAQDLLVKRVAERVAFVKQYLNKGFKFDPKTSLNLDADERAYPASKAQAEKFLKQYLQFQVANYLATDMEMAEAKKYVERNYERVERRVRTYETEDLWATYIDAFAHALDPHSSYFSRDSWEDFLINMNLSLEGIGATLSSKDGFTLIENLLPGGAAYKSNQLKTQDKIIAVAQGEQGEFENVIEMELRDVVRRIRGPKGSKVRLRVLRKSAKKNETLTVTLVRQKVDLEDEAAAVTYLDRKVGDKTYKIALLDLPSFYADTRKGGRSAASDVKKLLAEVRDKNVDSVVFDLSTNGGGSLDDAVKIAGLFFRVGNVVKQSSRDIGRPAQELADLDPKVDWPGPLVVLISRISASASEIVSGTLKDYKRAIIVGGDHTFGKGSVQSVQPLRGGAFGALKTTVGMFFTPGGNSTQHRGVDADIEFPSPYSTDEIGEKTLDYSLPPKSIKPFLSAEAFVPAGVGYWHPIDGKIIRNLKQASKKRVAKNKDFKEVEDEIKKAKKQGRTIVVGEILKEREEKRAEEKKKGVDPDRILSKEEKQKKYLERADIQEAVNIAADLAAELGKVDIKVGSKSEDQ
ncbi:MAG: carboxy terminal-processing peptidase [Pseudobdellovibrionaceae bacterium]|nr:carboxy terminal-processing peptidase [Bdellovibrionales bacterium]USN46112.1 MAG: carboxy terminal-processing peptidase [Pseudobdellovibrionaceae bacterium]